MDSNAEAGGRWGPDGRTAAVSLTLDNLGEAMELSTGTWPRNVPVGRHRSVAEVLPRVLEVLEEESVRCTYFAEGWSAGIYPEAVRGLQAAGHEVACHGWLHEHWADVESRKREGELISRAREGLRRVGVEPRGFRPPGGVLTPWTVELLAEHGFAYLSPAAERAAFADSLAILPFRWHCVDAYYFFPAFGALRRQFGDSCEPLPPSRLVHQMRRTLDCAVAAGAYLSLVFHPFLEEEPERLDAMRRVVRMVAGNQDIWCAPCGEHADWVREHPERFLADPGLDARSWR